jgi:hypothetical protein
MSIIVYNLGELRQALSGLGSALLIGYVRVSTDGKHQDTSVERQIFFTNKNLPILFWSSVNRDEPTSLALYIKN